MITLAVARTGASLYFNGEVTFGDLLTSASVLAAALTLYFSFWQDRIQRSRDVADSVRTAAADALAKLDRYAHLPEAVAESAQNLAVETSQRLAQPQKQNDVADARDYLWAGLTKDWQEARSAQRAEGIELAHVKLFGHRPDAYRGVAETIRELDEGARKCFDDLQNKSQEAVMSYFGKDRSNYQSAVLGNELRNCLTTYSNAVRENARQVLTPVRRRLEAVISGSDEQVIDRAWQTPDH